MHFETIIIIGSGKIACNCSNVLFEAKIPHKVMESNPSQLSMLGNQCKKLGVGNIDLEKYKTLEDAVLENSIGNTLIISANNEHIFKHMIFVPTITIINFHYGYLPDYRGMNIPSWVLYNEEAYTGVTWHYVNKNIDDGNIITQRKIKIEPSDTALNITKKGMELGIWIFKDFIFDFLKEPIHGENNVSSQNMHCYSRRQLPGDGYLKVDDSAEAISRILRAYDYGPLEYISKLKLRINSVAYKIVKYRIFHNNALVVGNAAWKSEYKIEKESNVFDFLLMKVDE